MNYDEQIKKYELETARLNAHTAKIHEEVSALKVENEQNRRAFDREMKKLSEQIGGIGNKFGSFTEGMAYPSMQRILMKKFGAEFCAPHVERAKNSKVIEFDVFAYSNGKSNKAWIVEVKSKLTNESLQQLLEQLRRFPEFFPEHADKELYGILAGVSIDRDLPPKVHKAGVYLASIHHDTFKLNVPASFKPKSFRKTSGDGRKSSSKN